MDQKTIIKEWFESWVTKDFSKIEEYFIEDIYYRECYGPIYCGLSQLSQWIELMKAKQDVLEWRIDRIFAVQSDIFVVEWYFRAREEQEYAFDGVSIIEFKKEKIKKLTEYQAKHETYRPFG
ncbi:nuclear transport factor 2 family protein [Enterococcus massiliensis]|uniref:nuclear transport factor 2 family protein n=1 Tax=Enterococcus massiliensis TaxID=1640685 RepID=UPI00065E49E1|nr:nuclear transport factor 2 family protein [Enterococcus massiliensis]